MGEVKIEFEDDVNLISFFEKLKENQKLVKENNGSIFFGDRFLLSIAKTCKSQYIKNEGEKTLYLKAIDAFGYKYSVKLNKSDKRGIQLFKVEEVDSNNPEYTNILSKENGCNDIFALYFIKKHERTENKVRK